MAKFADNDKFMFNNSINYKEIIANQLNAIAVISRQEYCGGYWKKTGSFTVGGQIFPLEDYKSDTREEYSNAVECLHDIIKPHFDAEMVEKSTKIFTEINSLRKKWNESSKDDNSKAEYRYNRREKMREIFLELNHLLGRIKYFDNVTTTRE